MRCFSKISVISWCLFVASLLGALTANAADSARKVAGSAEATSAADLYGALPLSFEENRGQADGQVRFVSRGSGYSFFLTPTGAVLSFAPDTQSGATVLQMQLAGASSNSRVHGLEELPGTSNYFVASNPNRWRMDVPTFRKVAYDDVYPGVSLVYYGNQRQMEYDFVVAPGANPEQIRLSISGAQQLSIDDQGNLVLHNKAGDVTLLAPKVYQRISGQNRPITGQWKLQSKNVAGFRLGAYDRSRALVIDPVLMYSSFLGGSQKNTLRRIAVDSEGNTYVAGYTSSGDFPAAPTPQALTFGNGSQLRGAFVAKIDKSGSNLVYSTYLSGSVEEEATGLAVDPAGNLYVAGTTHSPDFPTRNAYQSVCATHAGPCSSAFLTKISPSGDSILYSTYLGGSGGESARSLEVDAQGSAYVLGVTSSPDFPVTAGVAQARCGGACQQNAFVAKFDPTGQHLAYASYLGGSGTDEASDIALDSSANVYIAGHTTSPDFPLAVPFQKSCALDAGSSAACVPTAFVTKLQADGSAFVYSTYLGGTLGSKATAIAVDAKGSAYVAGSTQSSDFPVAKAFRKSCSLDSASRLCSEDAFLTKLDPTGKTLVYSTYLGGSGKDVVSAIAVDSLGNVSVVGITESKDFPVVAPIQSALKGTSDAFVARFNPSGSALTFSTYHGGSAAESGVGIALDAQSNIYITGQTSSTDFPTQHAFQSSCAGACTSSFVTKMSVPPPGVTVSTTTLTSSVNPSVFGQTTTLTATVTGGSGTPTGNVDFMDGATLLGNATLDATGTGVFPSSTLSAGSHSLSAVYNGDATYASSTSSAVSQTVNAASTTTAVTAAPASPSTFGESVTFTATIAAVAPGAGTPDGTVDFSHGGTTITGCGAQPVNGSGQATCITSSLAAGPYTILGTYTSVSGNFSTSNGTRAYTVNAASTTTTVTAVPATSAPVGTSVTFTATVAVVAPGVGTPVGTVDFTASGTAIAGCTGAAVNGSGDATCTTSALAAGGYSIKGTYNPTGGDFTTSNGSLAYALVTAPQLAKTFATSPIKVNGTTALNFTLTNPAANTVAQTGAAFTDTLPTGLTVPTAGPVTVCGGTLTTTAPTTISFTGGTIPAGSGGNPGTCAITNQVTVTGVTAGDYTNTTGAMSSTNGGTGSTASANLQVGSPVGIAKAFAPTAITLNTGTSTLTFTITNPNTTLKLTGINFTDTFPAGLVVAATPNLTDTCTGAATGVAGSSSVSLAASTLNAGASCTVSVSVAGNTAGVKVNSVTADSTEGGGGTSTATITIVAPPTITKAFANSVKLNVPASTSVMTLTLANPNSTVALTGVGVVDTLPSGMSLASGPSTTCTGGTANGTANVLTLTGASIPASGSCTVTTTVIGTNAGSITNTTAAVTSTNGGTGLTATANLIVVAAPLLAQAFNPVSTPLNSTSSLNFTITNPAANTVAETGVAFTDVLPAGLTVPTAATTQCGGTVSTTAPGTITFAGGNVAVGSSCTVSVAVTGAAAGSYSNIVDGNNGTTLISSTNGGTGVAPGSAATLTVAAPPAITKTFNPTTITLGATSTVTFTITNPASNTVSLTGVAFSDSLPGGLAVSSASNPTNTCGGTLTASAASISLSGATIPVGSCTVTVPVQGNTGGLNITNTTGAITSANGGTGNTATATITVQDYGFVAAINNAILIQGSTTAGAATVTVTPQFTYAGTVSSAGCNPSVFTCNFTSLTSGTQAVSVTVGATAAVGAYSGVANPPGLVLGSTDNSTPKILHTAGPFLIAIQCALSPTITAPVFAPAQGATPNQYSLAMAVAQGGQLCPYGNTPVAGGFTPGAVSGDGTVVTTIVTGKSGSASATQAGTVTFETAAATATAAQGSVTVPYFDAGQASNESTPSIPVWVEAPIPTTLTTGAGGTQTGTATLVISGLSGTTNQLTIPSLSASTYCGVVDSNGNPDTTGNNFGITCSWSASTPTAVTVTFTPGASASNAPGKRTGAGMWLALMLPAMVFFGTGLSAFAGRRKPGLRRITILAGLLTVLFLLAVLPSCGGGFQANFATGGTGQFTATLMGYTTPNGGAAGTGNSVKAVEIFTIPVSFAH